MKKLLIAICPFITIVMLLALISGCSGGNTAATSTAASTAASTQAAAASAATINNTATASSGTTNAATTTSASSSSSELDDIFANTAAMSSVKYDMVSTVPGQDPVTQKFWTKKNKMRIESTMEGSTSIMFIDTEAKTMITYLPDQNMAMKMDYSQAPQSAADEESIQEKKPVVTGTEVIDGKTCLVVTYSEGDVSAKAWIWKDKGLTIRIETTSTEGTMVMEMQNIDFSDIADSMFELPEGIEVTDMGQIGGSGFNIPTNFSSEE